MLFMRASAQDCCCPMPVQRSPFDLVIFDCDGVLVDSEVISCRTLVDILSPLDPSYDLQTVMRRYLGRPSSAVVEDYERMTGRPASTDFTQDWRARLFAAFARELQSRRRRPQRGRGLRKRLLRGFVQRRGAHRDQPPESRAVGSVRGADLQHHARASAASRRPTCSCWPPVSTAWRQNAAL